METHPYSMERFTTFFLGMVLGTVGIVDVRDVVNVVYVIAGTISIFMNIYYTYKFNRVKKGKDNSPGDV